MTVAIIILAAGSSSRMKSVKQLLPVYGKTLLGLTIENALKSNADEVFCVLGSAAEKIEKALIKYDVKLIINLDHKNGLGSSISAGVNHIKSQNFDAVLVMLGDQPKISPSYLNEMIKVFDEDKHYIIASSYSGKNGVPAIFSKTYFEDLSMFTGDKGAVELLNKRNVLVKTMATSASLEDIDTPEDYQKLIKD